jgi:hypothetical protein
MSGSAIPALSVTDFRAFLAAAQAALASPQTVARLSDLLTRNEKVLQAVREERGDLEVCREQHARDVAKTRREFDEQLRAEKDAWDREEAQRRARLEMDEAETVRRREWVDRDRQAAAALRCKLEQKFAPAHKALGEFQQQWEQDPNPTAERAREKAAARAAEN